MTAVLEFRSPIPVETPQGRGYAWFVEVDNHVQYWTVALNDTCALVTFRQDAIKAARSYTHGRGITDEQMRGYIGALPDKPLRTTVRS
jgi:hypothetical protein